MNELNTHRIGAARMILATVSTGSGLTDVH